MTEYKKQVAAAIIRDPERKILIAQRSHDDELPLMWEFPGGKLEPGETPEECVVREIKEELALDIQLLGVYKSILYDYDGGVRLTFFNAEITGGRMRLNVHEDVRWVWPREIKEYDFMPPDEEVVESLIAEQAYSEYQRNRKGDVRMDALHFAIQMERDGEKYYRNQAAQFDGYSLARVFLLLADDEKLHAEILLSRAAGRRYTLANSGVPAGAKSIFADLDGFKSAIRDIPDQLDIYEAALEMEKKSISMYEDCLKQASDSDERELFEYLAGQEKEHARLMDELVQAVRNGTSWVESAEFGIRKEY